MSTGLLLIFSGNILMFIAFVRNGNLANRLRSEWRKSVARASEISNELEIKKRELDALRRHSATWMQSSVELSFEIERVKAKSARMSKTVTDLSVAVDALMNGDASCRNGHRFYLDSECCPHCGDKQPDTYAVIEGMTV